MEDILVPFIVFASITAWVIVPKWLRHKAELAKEALKAKDPAEEERVRKLQERVENLENLVCRLDSEINYQIEKSMSSGRIVTSVSEAGNSQMPTTFMSVAAALEGRYQILKELGRGGMGIVFQAYDKQLNEQVAIKILSPMLSTNTDALERMKREVSAARRITHPNVIRIHDISEAGGLNFVSMEFFNGISLKDHIKKSGPLSLMQAFNIASQICDGLEAAHRQGVIHRDLKSQNIIINSAGLIKIIDFGLAHTAHLEGLTATGLIMGKPEYMAPEQVACKKVDERADLYSLGIILYEIFTGSVPFHGDSAIAVGFKQMKEDPPAPRSLNGQLPEQVEQVILKALAKEPLQRYRSADELKESMEQAILQKAGVSSIRDGRKEKLERERIRS
ncbi:MAG TPA: serine/threonine-protein kinase [Acidobacteriota bacterium]|nr:serine/threonine-protein kinase [Acidobacteriota bacterium]